MSYARLFHLRLLPRIKNSSPKVSSQFQTLTGTVTYHQTRLPQVEKTRISHRLFHSKFGSAFVLGRKKVLFSDVINGVLTSCREGRGPKTYLVFSLSEVGTEDSSNNKKGDTYLLTDHKLRACSECRANF